MSKRLVGVLVATLLAPVGVALVPNASATEAASPRTIPALREWSPAGGSFTLGDDPAIVLRSIDASALLSAAELLADDFGELAGVTPAIEVGVAADAGDIELVRSGETSLGTEGYRMDVAGTLKVSAPTVPGVFYGTQSVLQLLHQSPTIPAGTARDWPRYPDRGVMVDLGRRWYSPAFFGRLIKRMGYLKLNLLQLHLSDNEAFRIESTTHPEIVSEQHLTKEQVADLVSLAASHGITVVPEIDMPGHMAAILKFRPDLQLTNVLGVAEPSRLDVTKPAARALAKELIAEYLPLFPGPFWHIGADEYMTPAEYLLYPRLAQWARQRFGLLANGKDAVHDFVNDIAGFLKAHGRIPRMWGDDAGGGCRVSLDPALIVEWWTNVNPISDPLPPSPQALLRDGHEVLNNGWWPTYFGGKGLPEPVPSQAYGEWDVNEFYGVLYADSTVQFPPYRISASEPRNRGAKLAIWGDGIVRNEAQTETDTLPFLRLIAQKTWESPAPATYDEFLAYAAAIGAGPGQG